MSPRKAEITCETIKRNTIPEPNCGCWLWTGELNSAGYGRISRGNNRYGLRERLLAHRVSYEMHKGPVPMGMDLDHLCRVRMCVNPSHLEPVTRSENNLRGDLMRRKGKRRTGFCAQGHVLDPNAISPVSGRLRSCPICSAQRTLKYRKEKSHG